MTWWYLHPLLSLALSLAGFDLHYDEFISWMSQSGPALPLTKAPWGPIDSCSSAQGTEHWGKRL